MSSTAGRIATGVSAPNGNPQSNTRRDNPLASRAERRRRALRPECGNCGMPSSAVSRFFGGRLCRRCERIGVIGLVLAGGIFAAVLGALVSLNWWLAR